MGVGFRDLGVSGAGFWDNRARIEICRYTGSGVLCREYLEANG